MGCSGGVGIDKPVCPDPADPGNGAFRKAGLSAGSGFVGLDEKSANGMWAWIVAVLTGWAAFGRTCASVEAWVAAVGMFWAVGNFKSVGQVTGADSGATTCVGPDTVCTLAAPWILMEGGASAGSDAVEEPRRSGVPAWAMIGTPCGGRASASEFVPAAEMAPMGPVCRRAAGVPVGTGGPSSQPMACSSRP
jgi:hypothetical protein